MKPEKKLTRYLTVAQLKERWGNVSTMFIERRTRELGFPPAMRLRGSRIRLFNEADIEKYERASLVRRA
jgi:hypothetical protein